MKKDMIFQIDRVVRPVAIACGYACLGLCFLIGYEIFSRKLFGHSIQGVDEIGGYVLAVTAAVGFAYALLHRVHTRIDLAFAWMSTSMQAVANTAAAVMIAAFASFMAFRAWVALSESIEFGSRASTPLQTPLWIPQSIWVAGLSFFAFVAVAMAAHALVLLMRDHMQVNQNYGPPSLDEEIEEQVAEAERQLARTSKGETK